MESQYAFFTMLLVAIVVSRTPLRAPFQWMETFFHELSHGLAAIVTFGWIKRIRLHFNGAGSCTTVGGLRIPVLLAGYAGAVVWGALIYIAGWSLDVDGDVRLLYFLLGTLAVATVLWVRDLATLVIVAIMFGIFWLPIRYPDMFAPALAVEFYGLYVLTSAITAPLNLIDGKHVGDGAELADITLVLPEGVWIMLWFAFALVALFVLWVVTTQPQWAWAMQVFSFLYL